VTSPVAEALQRELERFAVPWYRLWPGRRRGGHHGPAVPLRIFRDETDLAATSSLPNRITRALSRSTWFILMASRAAAQPKWVAEEVAWWLALRPEAETRVRLTLGDIVAEFAAPVRGIPKDRIVGNHVRDRRRTRRLILSAIALLTALALAATTAAVQATRQTRLAEQRQRQATSRQLAAEAEAIRDTDPRTALRLSRSHRSGGRHPGNCADETPDAA
jgi:hypothetical protein